VKLTPAEAAELTAAVPPTAQMSQIDR